MLGQFSAYDIPSLRKTTNYDFNKEVRPARGSSRATFLFLHLRAEELGSRHGSERPPVVGRLLVHAARLSEDRLG